MKFNRLLGVLILLSVAAHGGGRDPLFIAPVYVEYLSSSSDEFANQVQELKQRIGERAGVRVGFSSFLQMRFHNPELNKPVDRLVLEPTLDDIDRIVERAR